MRGGTDTPEGRAALLRRRIRESGLSQVRFARLVLRRNPRSIRQWLVTGRIPPDVLDFLRQPTAAPWP